MRLLFSTRSDDAMTKDTFKVVLSKVFDYLDELGFDELHLIWTGGEALTREPEWYLGVQAMIELLSRSRAEASQNLVQSNLTAYRSERWDHALKQVFGNSIGTSLDFPNVHRRVRGGTTEEYDGIWKQRYREAKAHGLNVGIICVPNRRTLEVGARRFYDFFVHEMGIEAFQLNAPFPGASATGARLTGFPLDNTGLGDFYAKLFDIWMKEGYHRGIRVNPFDELIDYFLTADQSGLPCKWHPACGGAICINPGGNVMTCDAFVDFPQLWLGNILSDSSLSSIMNSDLHCRVQERPARIVESGECWDCDYLGLCHAGCPGRAFFTYGDLFRKDPYCEAMKALFRTVENAAYGLDPDEYRRNRNRRGL